MGSIIMSSDSHGQHAINQEYLTKCPSYRHPTAPSPSISSSSSSTAAPPKMASVQVNCVVCKKEYAFGYIKKHMSVVHGIGPAPATCNECGWRHWDHSWLQKHKKLVVKYLSQVSPVHCISDVDEMVDYTLARAVNEEEEIQFSLDYTTEYIFRCFDNKLF